MQNYYADNRSVMKKKYYNNCISIFAVALLIIVAFSIFNSFFVNTGNNSLKITDWTYTSGEKLTDLKDMDREWLKADSEHLVKIQNGNSYVLMRGKLPEAFEYDALDIKTSNSTITVSINSSIVYNGVNKKPVLAGNNIDVIEIPENSNGADVEIILYAPLAFHVDVYMTNKYNAANAASKIPYYDLIFALLFILLPIIFYLFLRGRLPANSKKAGLLLLMVGVLAGISVIVNPVYTKIIIWNSVILFKLGSSINVLLSGLVLFAIFLEKEEWNPVIEGIIGVNILYAICVLCSPYDVLTIALMKLCSILQMVNIAMFFYIISKFKITLSAFSLAVYLCYSACSVFHWFGIANQLNFEFRLSMLLAAVVFVCSSYISYYIENTNKIYMKKKKRSVEKSNKAVKASPGVLDEKIVNDFIAEDNVKIKIIPKRDSEIMAKKENGLIFMDINNVFDFYGALSHIVAEKCDGESHHLLHVAEYVRIICLYMGMNEEKAMFVAKASLLHDIGKICIPHDVLLKTDALSEEEYNQIRSHNIHGYNILNNSDDHFLKMAAQIAREHHENYNGTGYLGLKGDEISIYARIVTVADVFDALTSTRAYKKTWSFEEGMEYIRKQKNDYFDPDIASVFISCHDEVYKIYRAFKVNAELYGV